MPQRFSVARHKIILHGAVIEVDAATGRAVNITRVSEPLP
jgi:calcineurin-like phosphoesterase